MTPGHAHRPGPERSTLRCFEFMDIYVASLLYYVFMSLQDDQPAPATRSHLKLAVVLKDEEWALQTAESQDCFLMIFFLHQTSLHLCRLVPDKPVIIRKSLHF